MSKIKYLIDFLSHPFEMWYNIVYLFPRIIQDDRKYIEFMWKHRMDYPLNLDSPKTFNEKIQWLKLYDHQDKYTMMVDKYAVKKYVADIIGEEYIIPTLGVWEKPEEIEWDTLPDQFVLKCTHDSGGLVICRDKSKLDIKAAKQKLRKSLKCDYYLKGREWPYKNVPRRIIAEQLIESNTEGKDIPDYKWYCFDGEPKFCQVIQNRSTKETIDFFDTKWNHQEFVGLNENADNAEVIPNRPANLETHIRIARELSKNISFARIDIYDVNEKQYFGEVTLYPACGFGKFRPNQYNEILGNMLILPESVD